MAEWYHPEFLPKSIEWTELKEKFVKHNDVLALASELNLLPEIQDPLFDETSQLNNVLESISQPEFDGLNSEQKWLRIFRGNFPSMFHLISLVFSVPVSNSFIERVFSLATLQWTDRRNTLKAETIKDLLQVKVNFDEICAKMHDVLLPNSKLLEKIGSGEKYNRNN